MSYHHFDETKGTFPKGEFLKDTDYLQVLDSMPIVCVDVALIAQGRINPDNPNPYDMDGEPVVLMGKRAYEPAQGQWWLIGGRMLRGESFTQTAARKLKEELGLTLPSDSSDFHFVGVYNQLFARRVQPPQVNGVHTVAIVLAAFLNQPAELIFPELEPNKEYSKLGWYAYRKIVAERPGELSHYIIRTGYDLHHLNWL